MDEPFLRLAVIGDPVEHSKSPALHKRFLAEAGLQGSYEAVRVPAGTGARAIDDLRVRGYRGINVTTPLKEEAFAHAAWRDSSALASGSVNTLVLGETIDGYNTDGVGTLGALRDAGLPEIAGARVLVLGAGPAARAAVTALVAAAARVWVWNRNWERAETVARDLDAHLFVADSSYDAIFAALSPGALLTGKPVAVAVCAAPVFVDANYGERATLARSLGRSGSDGARMLEHSARASFELWRASLGVRSTE